MGVVIQTFLNPILPIFTIMLVGIACGRRGLFDASAARDINRFVFYVAVPALLFSLLSGASLNQVDWRLLALYFLSEMCLFATGAALARFVFNRDRGEALLLGMACCFVNHVFFVLPIAQLLYGQEAAVPITAIIVVDTTLIFGGTIAALEIGSHRGEPLVTVARLFFRNPILVAIFLGLLVNVSGIEVAAGITTFVDFAGGAAAPAALFSLGIILSRLGKGGWDPAAVTTALLKVVLHPLVALLLFGLIDVGQLTHDSALLVAAGPCGAMPFVLALQYKIPAETIGKAIIYSTIASLFTLAIIA